MMISELPPRRPVRAILGSLLLAIHCASGQDTPAGELLWTFDPGTPATNADFFTEPAIGPDGTIYLGHIPSNTARSGTFFAVNPDGSERWKETFQFPNYANFGGHSSSFNTPSIGTDGTVYFACGGTQYAYEADGTRKWSKKYFTTDPRNVTAFISPLAISNAGRLYLPQGDSGLFEIDPETGDSLWEFRSTNDHRFSFSRYASLTFEGDILFTAWDNHLFRLDPDGNLKFRYNSGGKDYPSGASGPALNRHGGVFGPQGDLYRTYFLGARSPQSGTFPTFLNAYPGVAIAPVIDHDQSLLFADRHGNLIKVDSNLQELWKLEGYADQSPILCDNGSIFAVSNNPKDPTIRNLNSDGGIVFEIAGQLTDPRATTPTYPEEHDTVEPHARLALSPTGRLYAAARSGKLYAFQAPGALSSSDWPKVFGGYRNAGVVTQAAPQITSQPVSLDLISGEPQQLSVGAIGRPFPSAQWYRNGEAIEGAIGTELTLGNQGIDDAGTYHVVLENKSGSAESEQVTVTVKHRLEVQTKGQGMVSISPEQEIFEHRSPVVLEASPGSGYLFEGWQGSLEAVENPLGLEMEFSKTIRAIFQDIEAPALTINESFPATTGIPEFTVTGSSTDNDAIASLTYLLNDNDPVTVPVIEQKFSFTVPLEFGENTLVVTSRDPQGLETVSEQIITWDPSYYWVVEAPETVAEAGVLTARIYLGSPGDIAGANFLLKTDPAILSFEGFLPADALVGTFQTVSESEGTFNLTFASLDRSIPEGKTLLGEISYRVRSLPGAIQQSIELEQIDLATANGAPVGEQTAVVHASVDLAPKDILGDANNNGRFDVGDAQILQRILGGLQEVRPWDSTLNDVNRSGALDIGDIIIVLKTAAGILPQPGENRARSRTKPIEINFDSSLPRARIVLESNHAEVGATIIAQVVVDAVPESFGGTKFTLKYPVEALRLIDESAHRPGDLLAGGALSLWNVSPDQNNYASQNGSISFAIGSAENWPGSEGGGVLAEFTFTVQDGASAQKAWTLELQESEISFDEGLTMVPTIPARTYFIGQPVSWPGWRSNFFQAEQLNDLEISGPNADPDRDGHSNELEYFLGTDPHAPDGSELISPAWLRLPDGQIHFGLEIDSDPAAVDLRPKLEASPDLLNWDWIETDGRLDWAQFTSMAPDSKPDAGKIYLLDWRPASASGKSFLRLKFD